MNEVEIEKLLNWYQENKRDLPWRHTNDPYKIWISEIMLQQTRVEVVKEYYRRFLSKLPRIEDLAKVKEDTLLKLWEGLGYYSRAKNLKKCASKVLELGMETLPEEEESLLNLPGIGPYTAGAILSIAYQKCYPAIDGNVLRVLSRIYEDDRDLLMPSVRKEYTSLLKDFMKEESARDFTESFIELGALVCIPNGIPHCELCPLKEICESFKHQTMLEYPKKKSKKERKKIKKTVFVFQFDGEYAIQKRKEGVLKGLYEFPNEDAEMTPKECYEKLNQKGYKIKSVESLGCFKHVFSHLEWYMTAYLIILSEKQKKLKFYSKQKIELEYSLPSAFQQIFQKIK